MSTKPREDQTLLRREIRFSMPNDFDLGEIRIADEIGNTSAEYREWLTRALAAVGKEALMNAQWRRELSSSYR